MIQKYLLESMLLGTALALVLFFFPWVRIWAVSQFELSGFAGIIEQFRAFEKFSPVPLDQFLSYHGVIGLTYDEPVVLLCVLSWSIARGSDVVSGELNRGTMEMLLAQPIPRHRILFAHATVAVGGLAVLCLLFHAGLCLGIETNATPMKSASAWSVPGVPWSIPNPWADSEVRFVPLRELVSPSVYMAATLNLFSLGFAVLGLSVMVSSWDQYRWRTIGLVIGVYVLQLLLFVLSKTTPRMAVLKPLTFLAAYQPDWMVRTIHRDPSTAWRWTMGSEGPWDTWLGPLGYSGVLLGLGTAAYAVALWRFRGRDLPAPH